MYQSGTKQKYTPCATSEVKAVQFQCLSKKMIESMSVVEITQDQLFESSGAPVKNGPCDLRLGVSKIEMACESCHEIRDCQGHFGHIRLNQPIYHFGLIKKIEKILRCVCHRCFRVKRGKNPQQARKLKQAKKIEDPARRLSYLNFILGSIGSCQHDPNEIDAFDKNFRSCGSLTPTKIYLRNYEIRCNDKRFEKSYRNGVISRREVKRILEGLSLKSSDCELLGFTGTKPIDLLIEVLVVSPPQTRPSVLMHTSERIEDDITFAYAKIVRANRELENPQLRESQKIGLVNEIERIVASIMVKVNRNMSKDEKLSKNKKVKDIKSISDRIKGKEGRIRQNLMGKRVDFSARDVITPDPNIEIEEIGIPKAIANKLTFPEQVTEYNYSHIIDLCLKHKVKVLLKPPEQCLRNEQGAVNVEKIQAFTREDMEKYVNYGMIAERVLENGDYVLINRQPTLHKMSMMAHKIRILPGNSFRLNISVCPPYNADFDGDQMNLHVPQSYESVAELKTVSRVSKQIIGPKNGMPTMGIVQDGLLGIHLLTQKNTFVTKEEIMNLVMWISDSSMMEKIETGLPIPAILKPIPLWTGKQVVSIFLPEEISLKSFKKESVNKVEPILIRKGEILSGTLNRQFVGVGVGTIIHSICHELGSEHANNFINNCQRLINNWLIGHSFSVGVSDVVPSRELSQKISSESHELDKIYYGTINEYRSQEVEEKHLHQRGKKIMESFEFNINLKLNNRLSQVQDLVKSSLSVQENNIFRIVDAKSKGSETNLAQIIYSVGNQNIDGKRCPQGFSKRTLPHFMKEDYSPQSLGYVYSSFVQGLRPHQFFFHSMAGRQGLSDTSVKTSHVGYLQRKITKALEDIVIQYDGSVRDSNSNLLQKSYGENGFCVESLEKHRFYGAECDMEEFKKLYQWNERDLKKRYGYRNPQMLKVEKEFNKLLKCRQKMRKIHDHGNMEYLCPIKIERILNKLIVQKKYSKKLQGISPIEVIEKTELLIQQCINFQNKEKFEYFLKPENHRICDEDCEIGLQIFRIHIYHNLASKIICNKLKLSKKLFIELLEEIKKKFFAMTVPAGEAVGAIAAQSIGQPTTQMTLNTFHLAGVSDRNVTLGLPRLQELLHCSKNIRNPSMIVVPHRLILHREKHLINNQEYLMEILTSSLPERKIQDFLIKTNYYFDPLPEKSKIGVRVREETKKVRTPWVIKLTFNSKKIGSVHNWDLIFDRLEKRYAGIFEIYKHKGFLEMKEYTENPEITLRYLQYSQDHILPPFDKKIATSSVFSYLSKLEQQLKSLEICGVLGIKSVKTMKKLYPNIHADSSSILKEDEKENHFFMVFVTNGSNFKNVIRLPVVNPYKTMTNNLTEVLDLLGIEAARQMFLREFIEVLNPYGIQINPHHLLLLADWMCSRGTLTPINRTGFLRAKDISILRKATYEEASKVFFEAAASSQIDQLKGVSEQVIFGQQIKSGTSQCSLFLDLEKIDKFKYRPEIERINDLELQMLGTEKTPDHSITFHNNLSMSMSRSFMSHLDTSRIYQKAQKFSPMYSPFLPANLANPSPNYNSTKMCLNSFKNSPRYSNSPLYGNSMTLRKKGGEVVKKQEQDREEGHDDDDF